MDETPGPSGTAETATEDASEERTAHEILCQFSEEWLKVLDRDDKKSLVLFLCYNLTCYFKLNNTQAAEMAAQMVNKSDRTV